MCLILNAGFNSGRRNVDFCHFANHDTLPSTSWSIWLQWTCHQPTISSFANSLPRLLSDLDVIVVRKEGTAQSHHNSRVRRSWVLSLLHWLQANNIALSNVLWQHSELFNLRALSYIDTACVQSMPPSGRYWILGGLANIPSSVAWSTFQQWLCDFLVLKDRQHQL